MRVTLHVGEGVVFAMHRGPFTGLYASGQPKQKPEGKANPWIDCHSLVCAATMEKNRCRKDRDLTNSDGAEYGNKWLGHPSTLSVHRAGALKRGNLNQGVQGDCGDDM